MAKEENRLARELESREADQREQAWAPPQLLPDPVPQPGWRYHWKRISILGASDPMNMSSAFREGWEPVKVEEQPTLMLHADPNSRFAGCIEVGGLLLCKMPEEKARQRDAFYGKHAQAQMQAVDNNLMKVNDSRMPLFNQRQSEVEFGRGSK